MKSILFMMFFVTPPALKGHEVWTLQNNTNIEFADQASCNKVGLAIQAKIKTTDTVQMRGWCFTEETVDVSGAAAAPGGPPEKPQYKMHIEQLGP